MPLMLLKTIPSDRLTRWFNFLEEEFEIAVEDEELIPENLDSINNVTAYLEGKLQN